MGKHWGRGGRGFRKVGLHLVKGTGNQALHSRTVSWAGGGLSSFHREPLTFRGPSGERRHTSSIRLKFPPSSSFALIHTQEVRVHTPSQQQGRPRPSDGESEGTRQRAQTPAPSGANKEPFLPDSGWRGCVNCAGRVCVCVCVCVFVFRSSHVFTLINSITNCSKCSEPKGTCISRWRYSSAET